MKIEHAACQVEDPAAMARWYVEHLGMRVVRASDDETAFFLADSAGTSMIEIYRNPAVDVPDWRGTDPLHVHLAFAAEDVAAARAALLAAGATAAGEVETTPAGDVVAMHRDPWGFPVQLVRRQAPMP